MTTPARLTAWRCPTCRTLLMRLALGPGSVVEVKCSKCNTLTTIEQPVERGRPAPPMRLVRA